MTFIGQNPKWKENSKRKRQGTENVQNMNLGTKVHKHQKLKDLGCNFMESMIAMKVKKL